MENVKPGDKVLNVRGYGTVVGIDAGGLIGVCFHQFSGGHNLYGNPCIVTRKAMRCRHEKGYYVNKDELDSCTTNCIERSCNSCDKFPKEDIIDEV